MERKEETRKDKQIEKKEIEILHRPRRGAGNFRKARYGILKVIGSMDVHTNII